MEEIGSIEEKSDIEKGQDGVVRRWLLEIKAADKSEDQWRKSAAEALKIYSSEDYNNDDFAKRKETFNILWANTETVRPVLYNSTPRPDIRRRYRDKDPLGKAVSEVCERAVSYTLDAQDFDVTMIAAVNTMLLPGRSITRVRYVPSFNDVEGQKDSDEPEEELAFEEVVFQDIQWDDFRRGPGKTWEQVPWIGFKHLLTKDEVNERFPDFSSKIKYDTMVTDYDENDYERDRDKDIFKRALIWEIWDKDEKEVIFFSPSYKDKVLLTEPDPLSLRDFWPIPRPLYAIENVGTLVPMTKFSMYETLAKELESVTNRIRKILNGLRLRGIYDSRLGEIEKLFDSFDNSFIPAENIAGLLEAVGSDLSKAIWTLPIQMYSDVLIQLYEYRQGLIRQIYEITGISDVIRGDTNPNETLGAQQLKADYGSQRMQREQREVQRYARDLIRMTVELISEKFDVDTLRLMTGLSFPTNEEKQKAQAQIQMQQQQAQQQHQQASMLAQQQGQQVPPFQPQPPDEKIVKMLQSPSWEDIQEVMSNDMMRDYRIDIETDSTIQSQQQQDQKNITELLKGITDFIAGVAEPIAAGFLTIEAAKAMLLSAVRRFKLGREVEDAIEDIEAPKNQNQGVPQEQVQQQMQQVQQQAKEQVQKSEQEFKQHAQEYKQRCTQQAGDAQAKAKEFEQRCKAMLDEGLKKAQMEVATEKARNKLAEEALNLDQERQLFEIEKKLHIDAMHNDNTKHANELNAAVTVYQADKNSEQAEKTNKEANEHEAKDVENKSGDSVVKIDGLDNVLSMLGNLFKSKEVSMQNIVKELNKPRTVTRDDDGDITGIK